MSVSDERFAHTAHSHRRPHTLALIVALSATALFAATSPASAPSDLVLFPTVTVAATCYGTAPFDMPFATSVLSAASLDTRQPRTLPIALEEQPGLMVQKTSSAQGAPYIRGFTGFRTLLLIDGIRLNNSVFREGPNQYWGTVDPLSLARLELVKGPASVLYGSDAVGGTVRPVYEAVLPVSVQRNALFWDVLATLAVILVVTGLGFLSNYVLGKYFVSIGERAILRIPAVGAVRNLPRTVPATTSPAGVMTSLTQ